MRKNSSNKIVSTIFIVLIVCLTLTLLQGYFPLMRRQWIFLMAICITGVIYSFSYCITRQFSFLFLYFIIVTINAFSGDLFWGVTGRSVFEFTLLLAPAIMTYYAFENKDEKFMKTTLIVFFSIVVFESLASFISNLSAPEIVRSLNFMKMDSSSSEMAYYYYRLGVANYDIGHALPALTPMMVMAIKHESWTRKKRVGYFILFLFTLLLIYVTYSTISLILTIGGIILAFFSRKGSLRSNIAIILLVIILFLPFLLSDTLSLRFLGFVDSFVDSQGSLHGKIVDIQESIMFGEASGDIQMRGELYSQSFDLFLTNFFIGTNAKVGGHSSIIDRLATLGIVGFIPYVVFLWNQLKYGKKLLNNDYSVVYFEAIVIGLLMLFLKDSDSWEMFFILFTVIPFFCYKLFQPKYDN